MKITGYKRPESVLVVVFTEDQQVLLLQRVDVTGFRQSVTGSLHDGETPFAAAQRELREETGLVIASEQWRDCQHSNRFPIVPPWKARYAPDVTHNIEHVFTCCLPHPQPVQINPAEHCSWCWLPVAEAAQQATSWTNRAAIEQFCYSGQELRSCK